MPVLDRGELERSPLADLHAIAAELGVEGFRRLRREELVAAIVDHAGGGDGAPDEAEAAGEDAGRRGRTAGGGGRRRAEAETPGDEERPGRRRGSRGRGARSEPAGDRSAPTAARAEREIVADEPAEEPEAEAEPRTGVLEILPNGSGFLRGESLAPARGDVHVSPAQIRRCELRSGDEVTGPVRPPRRSERHPSLIHVESVNGAPAEPPAERVPFDEAAAAYASERLAAPDELAAIPFGKGSRVAVVDPPGAEAVALLRRMVAALRASDPDLSITVALTGVRPEDAAEWRRGEVGVVGGGADGSAEAQSQAAELALERAKRIAERGGHAVLVVDSLEALAPDAGRRIFAAARRLEGAGSLTVIGTIAASDTLARLATTRIMLEPGTGARGDEPPSISPASDAVRADMLGG